MEKIQAPQDIDKSLFAPDATNLTTRFGLPKKVVFCKRCVISNQRPNSAVEYAHTKDTQKKTIFFDAEGICDACRFAEKKNATIDWDERERQLRDLLDQHRSRDGKYDCILPGSGGKDSFYASHILRTKYGMHPLTVTWAPHIYTDWGWKNFQSWIHAGHDNMLMTPNGRVHRLLTRLAVDHLFHPFQAFMFGQKSLAPKMALLHKIPLVIYGENEAEYGNPIGDTDTAKRDWSYFTSDDQSKIYLGGVSIADLKNQFGVEHQDLLPYLPADPNEIERQKVEVHYLGYYLKWHPQSCYYYAVEHGGFQASPERTPGTYSKYNSIDDRIDDFHYYTTGVKFGIGRATYDAVAGNSIRRHRPRRGRRTGQAFRSRISVTLCRGDLPLSEHSGKGVPGGEQDVREPDHDRTVFCPPCRQFPFPQSVEVGRQQLAIASCGVGTISPDLAGNPT